jgi:hypothetical protein
MFSADQLEYFKRRLEGMTYVPLYPTWFFSPVNIPNLDLIKKELVALEQLAEDRKDNNTIYTNIYKDIAYKHCPLLKEYLQSVGLDRKFNRILFSKRVVLNDNKKVHVDSYNPLSTTHSLNIPLIDYEDSYTAWYKTDRQKLRDSLRFGMEPINNFAFVWDHEVEEINRYCYASGNAVLVNTTILHKGLSDKQTRMICGLRFFPELTTSDIKRLGIQTPYVQ